MKHDPRKARAAQPARTDPHAHCPYRSLDGLTGSWSPQQAIAVYDFCTVLQRIVWQRFIDVRNADLSARLTTQSANRDDPTRPLPFDDDAEPF